MGEADWNAMLWRDVTVWLGDQPLSTLWGRVYGRPESIVQWIRHSALLTNRAVVAEFLR